jgi:hypothetical protein
MSPRVLREVILENFEKINEPETSTSDKFESVRVLRNRKINIFPDNPITKSLTFSYFSYTFLNSISIKLSFAIFLYFKEDTNNIYSSMSCHLTNLTLLLKTSLSCDYIFIFSTT